MDNKSYNNNIVGTKRVDSEVLNDALVDLGLDNKDLISSIDNNPMESNWTQKFKSFEEMGLKFNLLKGIYGHDFEIPSPIQQLAIVPMIRGNDVICQAQAGSGKTATFAISALQLIDTNVNEVQTVVLSPTRELAKQTTGVFRDIGNKHLGLKAHFFIGGTEIKKDINVLQEGVHVVSGTPGRTISMIDKKLLKLTNLKVLIIDEADEMLTNEFLKDMKKVISCIPPDCKIWLVSATMPKPIVELTSCFMNNPIKILVRKEDLPLEGVKQYYVLLKKEWKLDTLIQLYKGIDISQAMIFCNSKKQVVSLAEDMKMQGHAVTAIHSELNSQEERNKIMEDFTSGKTRVLITTDLLAKGIDVYAVNLVINYDFPTSKEVYLHRVGRCGRYGRKGKAINFVQTDEFEDLESVQKYYNVSIESLPKDLAGI